MLFLSFMTLLTTQTRELDLGSGNRAVENGTVQSDTREYLVQALGQVQNPTAVTVVVCVGEPPLATAKQAVAAGETISHMIGEILPRLVRSVAARQLAPEFCPTGARLTISANDIYGQVKEARVVALMGEVTIHTRDGRDVPVYQSSIVPERGDLITKAGARATIQLPDNTRIIVRENSRVNLASLQSAEGKGTPRIKLLVGTFWSRFTKLVGGHDLEVESPNAVAGVRGTDFQMDAGEKAGSLAVYHGNVGVSGGGKKVDVPEGMAVVTAKVLSDPRPVPPAPDNLLPRQGKFKNETRVRWDPVPNAKNYHFELSRDIGFVDVLVQVDPVGTLLKVKAPPGKYFWRVMSRDQDNIESKPSKIYAIEFE